MTAMVQFSTDYIKQSATFTCIHDHKAYNERLPVAARFTEK